MPRFHPARPAPLTAPQINSRDFFQALTPAVAALWLEEGRQFSLMCIGDQDYLTLGAYFKDVLRYTRDINSILNYYEAQE